MDFSYVQLQILAKLLTSDSGLRYSEAHPEGIDDDLYNYHLQFLVKKGYVVKEGNLYKLSDSGKVHVQAIDVLGNLKGLFKFSVLPYVVKDTLGKRELLLQKRLRHPYFGDIHSISGKVHIGESVEAAARRKLEEETRLICDFKFLGVIRKIRRNNEGRVIEDTLYHICYGENPTGDLEQKNIFGENFWESFEFALEVQKRNITAGKPSEDILERIRNKNFELFYVVEDLILQSF